MASYRFHRGSVDISTTNPYPLGVASVLCQGTDITLHVPSTGIHLNLEQAGQLVAYLASAIEAAILNKNTMGC